MSIIPQEEWSCKMFDSIEIYCYYTPTFWDTPNVSDRGKSKETTFMRNAQKGIFV